MYPCLYLASSTIQSEKQILRSKSSKQSMLTSLLEEKSNSSTSQEKSEAPGHSSSKQEIFGAVSYHHGEFPDELMEDESYGRLSVEESMAPGGLPKEEGVAHESEQDTPGGLPKEEGVARESEQDTPGDLPKEEGVACESEQDTPGDLPKEEGVVRESEQDTPGGLPKEEGVARESEQDTPGDLPKKEGVARESEQDTPGDLPKEEGVALEGLRELEVRSGLPSGAAPGCILLEENEVVTSSPCTEEVPMWMRTLNLTGNDKVLLEHGGCLNDQIIFSAQKLLQNNFPNIQGWQSTHCSYANQLFKPITDGAEYAQILLTRGNHWITVSNILRHNQRRVGGTFVAIYDSLRGLYIEHK